MLNVLQAEFILICILKEHEHEFKITYTAGFRWIFEAKFVKSKVKPLRNWKNNIDERSTNFWRNDMSLLDCIQALQNAKI